MAHDVFLLSLSRRGRIKEDLLKNRAALEEALSRLSGERDDMLDRQLVKNLIVRLGPSLL